jgi:hypothetical protein
VTVSKQLDALAELLAEERSALRCLDADRVEALAGQKQSLLVELSALRGTFAAQETARFTALRAELRDNLLLLLHAKDCVAGVVAALREAHGTTGVQVSVRG